MEKGRRFAFDFGISRIGIATTDQDGLLAFPLSVVKNTKGVIEGEIAQLIDGYSPIHLYVGLPILLSGNEGESAKLAREFGERLQSRFNLPVDYIDERLSTVTASRNLRAAGKDARSSKEDIDAAAAVEILEMAIQSER